MPLLSEDRLPELSRLPRGHDAGHYARRFRARDDRRLREAGMQGQAAQDRDQLRRARTGPAREEGRRTKCIRMTGVRGCQMSSQDPVDARTFELSQLQSRVQRRIP